MHRTEPEHIEDFIPATDPSTLDTVAVGDFIRAEGIRFGQPRTWGGRITRIGCDEHGMYFSLREPIQAGILWEGTASTITDTITIITDETERASILKAGNFTAKRPRPRFGGYKSQYHHGFPENGDWTGHRIAYYAGNDVTLWGDCLHDDDGDIWVIFDGESMVYTTTRGEIYVCEHERPCGKPVP